MLELDSRNGIKRVVVTGMGALTCVGNTTGEFWDNLKRGSSGIGRLTRSDPDALTCKVSGEIKNFNPAERLGRREIRRMGLFSNMAVAAAFEAIENARLDLSLEDKTKVGVLLGVGAGGLPETDVQVELKLRRGLMRLSPFFVPVMLVNMASANVSRIFGAQGYINTCTTACAAATQAIGEAYEVIKRGEADVMLTGGCEAALCPVGLGSFSNMGALTSWEGDPIEASRPFDSLRDGFVPAEGAGVLTLESLKHAEERGAEPLAEVLGWGATSDALELVQPDSSGAGAERCMRVAMDKAGVEPDEIDYVNAHGTSTPLNDKAETIAIKSALKGRAYSVPISSTKSMVGHALGASGALEAIASVCTIQEGMIHPTINYKNPDPDCNLDYVPNKARRVEVKVVLSNSLGFGGQNASLILGSMDR